MTTTEALDPKSKAVDSVVRYAINDAKRAIEIAEKSREILMRLPEELINHASACSSWLQFSNCSRGDTETILRSLNAGRWEKKVSTGSSEMLDYEGFVNGVRIIIYQAPPPGSCRIIEETEEVPAHTITKRKLICAPDKPVADCLALARTVAATTNEE